MEYTHFLTDAFVRRAFLESPRRSVRQTAQRMSGVRAMLTARSSLSGPPLNQSQTASLVHNAKARRLHHEDPRLAGDKVVERQRVIVSLRVYLFPRGRIPSSSPRSGSCCLQARTGAGLTASQSYRGAEGKRQTRLRPVTRAPRVSDLPYLTGH